ncbi:hypothetical protein L596_025975 [Steinernema carpocapsae]|uniref:Uncharacterized protein n=1 Tax=Steinernema carpocapsae TaxID=34508 RepID=A0A4U5M9E4_STECR|nr:hypothetical protein L596_025975 [Steinernema carpocapsae]
MGSRQFLGCCVAAGEPIASYLSESDRYWYSCWESTSLDFGQSNRGPYSRPCSESQSPLDDYMHPALSTTVTGLRRDSSLGGGFKSATKGPCSGVRVPLLRQLYTRIDTRQVLNVGRRVKAVWPE